MATILVLNGPNLNLLGTREPEIYGDKNLQQIEKELSIIANENNCNLESFQSNSESDLVDMVQERSQSIDYMIINPGAFTHTSIALIRSNKGNEAEELMRRMASRLSAIDYNNEWLGTVEFNLARVLALTGDIAAAEHTKRAIVFNPKAAEWIANEADFDSVRDEIAQS